MRFFIISVALLFFSCEKAVDFELEEAAPKLVVEATIENGGAPVVVLSRSLNYFSQITPALLAQSFVHGAVITISNGMRTHQLKEYALPVGGGVHLYYYSTDSASPSTAITGELGKSYSLHITVGGEEYEAKTTIPQITKKIDSMWWKPRPLDTTGKKVVVMIRATDPAGFGDYVRFWTKRNRENFLPGFNSIFDDLVIDGTTYEVQVDPGFNRLEDDFDTHRSFQRGDTVVLKLSNIDKNTFTFWQTMEYTYASVGNPFSTPVKVLGNISNGALGYFGGYASQFRTIIIPQ